MPKLAWLKRPSGGGAGARTHFYRAAGRGRSWIDLAPGRPSPRSRSAARGAVVPFYYLVAGFTRMLNHAGMGRGKQGNELLLAERPVPCYSSSLPSPVHKGRSSPDRRSATPLLASDRLCIDDARALLLVGECPHDRPPAPGVLFPARFPLFMQQAEQCLLLEKRAQVK